MPELDLLRGLAILSVVFYHGLYWSAGEGAGLQGVARAVVLAAKPGWLGVNLFFVLSGFLITGILLDSNGRADYFKRFYARRALRILPAYYLFLVVLLVVGTIGLPYFLLSFVYLSNFAPALGVPMQFAVLWSLAVEEQFYLVWPAIVRFASPRAMVAVALGIIVAAPALRGVAFARGISPTGIYMYTWLVPDGLATGALVAAILRLSQTTRRHALAGSLLLVAVAVLLGLAGAGHGIWTRQRLWGAMLQLTCANLAFGGLLLAALVIGSTRPLRSRVLAFFGQISYGLYLVHLLAFGVYDHFAGAPGGSLARIGVRFVVAFGAGTALAALSRYTFEAWFLRWKSRVS
jgi:peptidoglycan/LPS O-acetylase OafA/YrhL